MSGPFKDIGENELGFFFETNEPIPARPLLNFLYEVERIALTKRHLGPSAIVEITEVRTGTKAVRLTFNQKLAVAGIVVGAGTLSVEVTRLGLDIADRLQHQTNSRLAQSAAEMCADHGVVESTVTTHRKEIRIPRGDMPAVVSLEERRNSTSLRESVGRSSFPLEIDDAASESEVRAVHIPDLITQRGEIIAGAGVPRKRQIYTVVGTLTPAGFPGNAVPRSRGQFRTQSGKTYVVRGVDWDRAPPSNESVVIRADIESRDGEYLVLNVKDVFQAQEP